jgi:N-acetylneuraminic acid mutarotase
MLPVGSSVVLSAGMARETQYEVYVLVRGKWELLGAFRHFEPAGGLAQLRSERVRLVRVYYEDGREVERELLLEVGVTRNRD